MPGDLAADSPALAALQVLRQRADAFFTRVQAAHSQDMRCGPGCASCCRPGLTVFTVEAVALRAALHELESDNPELRRIVRAQAQGEHPQACPLLVCDRCAVYAARPLICATHGLPSIDSDASAVAGARAPSRSIRGLPIVHCELNFAPASAAATVDELRSENVMDLAALNRPLAVIAELYEAGAPRLSLRSLAQE